MNKFLTIGLLALLSFSAFGQEEESDLAIDVQISGFFSPEIDSAKIVKVKVGSDADKLGIKAGDKIISIDGCEVPSCPAREGEKLMDKPKGQLIPLILQRSDGSTYSANLTAD